MSIYAAWTIFGLLIAGMGAFFISGANANERDRKEREAQQGKAV
jgi:hypothetical protein